MREIVCDIISYILIKHTASYVTLKVEYNSRSGFVNSVPSMERKTCTVLKKGAVKLGGRKTRVNGLFKKQSRPMSRSSTTAILPENFNNNCGIFSTSRLSYKLVTVNATKN